LVKAIALSGIDGSGKSTLAPILCKHLSGAEVVWFRWRALTLYALYFYSRLRGFYIKAYAPRIKRHVGVHVLHIDPVAKILYPYFLYVDLTLFYLIHKLLSIFKRRRLVIFDRFYLDALVDVIHACRRVDKFVLKLFISMHMRISKAVLLDIDVNTALARKRDIFALSTALSLVALLWYTGFPQRPIMALTSSGVYAAGNMEYRLESALSYTITCILLLTPSLAIIRIWRHIDWRARLSIIILLTAFLLPILSIIAPVDQHRWFTMLLTIITTINMSKQLEEFKENPDIYNATIFPQLGKEKIVSIDRIRCETIYRGDAFNISSSK
jgi:hypothetical protein